MKTTFFGRNNKVTVSPEETAFNLTMANVMNIGGLKLSNAGIECLIVDDAYQRNVDICAEKIMDLVDNFDINKLEPLTVSIRRDEKRLAIINGMHRYYAMMELGYATVPVVLVDFGNNRDERLLKEAELFATQNDNVHRITPIDGFKANLIRNIPEYVTINNICKQMNIPLTKKEAEQKGGKKLTSLGTCLRMAKTDAELTWMLFETLKELDWHVSPGGYECKMITAIFNVFMLHRNNKEIVKEWFVTEFKNYTPKLFKACAIERYPERTPMEQIVTFCEDELEKTCGLSRVYTGDISIGKFMQNRNMHKAA